MGRGPAGVRLPSVPQFPLVTPDQVYADWAAAGPAMNGPTGAGRARRIDRMAGESVS